MKEQLAAALFLATIWAGPARAQDVDDAAGQLVQNAVMQLLNGAGDGGALDGYSDDEITTGKAELLGLIGTQALQAGNTAKALPLLAKAHALAPHRTDVLNNYGIALMRSGKLTEAARVLDAGVRAGDGTGEVLYNLACARARLDDASGAIDALSKAIHENDKFRRQAARDQDFAGIREHTDFRKLIGG